MAWGSVVFPIHPGTWDLLGKCRIFSMTGISMEAVLGEVPLHSKAGGFGGFSSPSVHSGICVVFTF